MADPTPRQAEPAYCLGVWKVVDRLDAPLAVRTLHGALGNGAVMGSERTPPVAEGLGATAGDGDTRSGR